MAAIIKVENLYKRYIGAEYNSVDGVSFDVEEGSAFALLGPNGAGKTSTMSILITNLSKTSGKVEIAGYDVDNDSHKIREQIGVIFQKPSLDVNLTAEENIRFHAVIYGLFPFRPAFSLMPHKYKTRLYELSEILGMQDSIFKKISTFSGGMMRRFEIIRGLMHNPRILFLDEPTTGVDPVSRKGLWDYLKKVRAEQGVTVFFTTHYLNEAEEADRICVISKGKVIKNDTPYAFKKDLLREFAMLEAKNGELHLLEAELKEINVPYTITSNNVAKVDLRHIKAQELFQKLKLDLQNIDIHSPSLEDAYLDIISKDNGL